MPETKNLPNGAAPVKGGPYMRISVGSKISDPVPLFGNPVLK